MPDWADNSDYATNSARVVNRQSLCGEISQRLTQHDSAYWLHLLEQHQVPCGPINSIDQVFQDPQILARNMLVTMEDKRAGEVQLVGNPINYSRSGIEYTVPPPILGDNTDSVLGEYLEYSELEISTLRNKSII
jgi:crotonobetainyl-CoA:carnitine CoA-transferase CaiB-like acyl-CoA transferase